MSRVAQWRQVERSTGHAPAGLRDAPECPPELAYIWTTSNKLAAAGNRLTYSEVQAYMHITRDYLAPWEIDALMRIDAVRYAG